MEQKDEIFQKIVFSGSGATDVASSFIGTNVDSSKLMSTTGVTFQLKELNLDDNTKAKLQCWVLSAAERFDIVRKTHYQNAFAVIFSFNPNDEKGLEKVTKEIIAYKIDHGYTVPLYLVCSTNIHDPNLLNQAKQVSEKENVKFFNFTEIQEGLTQDLKNKLTQYAHKVNDIIEIPLSNQKKCIIDFSKINKVSLIAAADSAVKVYSVFEFKQKNARERLPNDNKISDANAISILYNFLKDRNGDSLNSYKYQVVAALFGDLAQTEDDAKTIIFSLKSALESHLIKGQTKTELEEDWVKVETPVDLNKVNVKNLKIAFGEDVALNVPLKLQDKDTLPFLFNFLNGAGSENLKIKVVSALFEDTGKEGKDLLANVKEELKNVPGLTDKAKILLEEEGEISPDTDKYFKL